MLPFFARGYSSPSGQSKEPSTLLSASRIGLGGLRSCCSVAVACFSSTSPLFGMTIQPTPRSFSGNRRHQLDLWVQSVGYRDGVVLDPQLRGRIVPPLSHAYAALFVGALGATPFSVRFPFAFAAFLAVFLCFSGCIEKRQIGSLGACFRWASQATSLSSCLAVKAATTRSPAFLLFWWCSFTASVCVDLLVARYGG